MPDLMLPDNQWGKTEFANMKPMECDYMQSCVFLIVGYSRLLQKPREAQGRDWVSDETVKSMLNYNRERRVGFWTGDQAGLRLRGAGGSSLGRMRWGERVQHGSELAGLYWWWWSHQVEQDFRVEPEAIRSNLD